MWIITRDKLPDRRPNTRYSQVPCFVYYKGRICILVFNHEHECWDDETGDDYECDILDVSHWMPFPDPPTSEELSQHALVVGEKK